MIIACSAGALRRIQEARFRRVAKVDGQPLIVDGKHELAAVRGQIASHDDAGALIWNLDLTEAPVTDGEKTLGCVVTGYLYQHTAQFVIVLNSLDDADLCRIGSVARDAVHTAFAACRICPSVTDDYLSSAEALAEAIVKASGLKFAYRLDSPVDKTLVLANADRSAAAGLTKVRNQHEALLFGKEGAYVSHVPVDLHAHYRLNERRISCANQNGGKRASRPFIEMRNVASRFAGNAGVPAVDVKLSLIDDRYLYRKYKDVPLGDVPECWRIVRVPIDAPLFWMHEVIQKTFNWYDYHLHRFSFLDFEAREAFDGLFDVELGVERFDDDEPLHVRQARYDEQGGHERFKRLTGLDDKWLIRVFGPYAASELVHDDFPQASLPEDTPIGLVLFGSARYEDLMGPEHVERDRVWRRRMREYHAAIRSRRDQGAGAEGVRPGETPEGDESESVLAKLKALDAQQSNALYYNYDFGDNWELAVEATSVCVAPASELPRVVGGAGHTPPEDCGGIGGFKEVIAAYDLVGGPESWEGGPDDPDLIDAQDKLDWAYHVVGWRPFEGAGSLGDVFNEPGRM